ncbi:FMN-dependent dehydrogenase, includes L-lactate dehydrogenase and type II isopentenyl diphosphate isomerase [Butyrivibrio sp. INlla18]|uniref:alpha-hydroxy-acid oxidizing protein n=1 Tax=Butyrivibrio sp. INlla18 TaxID=1520806 RepID=UPI00088A1CC1|nr:alpha-hydroxy-acid oxidizing protein [Butyrivibrio sp. INlla18]SDA37657.1 FMN-dependent dehydrogenase, includes L-lactate dehydrogenase and type II isopentenyl diphosphate isomerase [Butyrivibrio sp. INlla18]
MAYTREFDANIITQKYMDSILIEPRYIDSKVADTTIDFFGEAFSMPVMTPAFSHLGNYNGRTHNGLEEYSMAAKEVNILNFCGMMENDQFKRIADTGAKTVRIVKPYADNGKVRDQFQFAKEVGAFGIGMDIDHIFGENGYDLVVGEDMTFQTADMLRSYVEMTDLPFVVKGVLSVADAVKCADIGAKAIIVSHHHGRIPYAIPPMMALPKIKEALKGRNVKIIVDCGIESGADVFKALALGADAAAVGRSMLPSLESEGTEGVKKFIEGLGRDLRYLMSSTGFSKVSDIDDSVIHFMK